MREAGSRAGRVALVAALALLVAPAVSAGAAQICAPGAGAGQCSSPKGLAVDSSEGTATSGRLYVADEGNDRVDVFDSSGAFLFSFGEGQLEEPRSVAVDEDPGSASYRDVFVVDFGHRRVLRYEPDGTLLNAIGEGEYSSSGPENSERMLVASGPDVDAPLGPDSEVWVADSRRAPFNASGECKIEAGHAEGGGAAEKCVVTRLRRYGAGGGAPTYEADLVSVARNGAVGGNLAGLAVDSAGDAYLRNSTPGESLCEYDPEGGPVAGFGEAGCLAASETVGVNAIALDGAGHLFAGGIDRDAQGSPYRVIAEYDAAGAPLRRFGYHLPASDFVEGLAVASGGSGPVYASRGGEVVAIDLPPPGPVAVGLKALPTTANAAASAEVNPEGKETRYRFQWVLKATCEEDVAALGEGHCFDHAAESEEGEVAAGMRLEPAEGTLGCPDPLSEAEEPQSKCLAPEAQYSWRVVAENEDGAGEGTVRGEDFTTNPSPEILDAWSTGVGTDRATLHAEVNPQGVPASGFFEYVSERSFAESGFAGASEVPDVAHGAAPLDFGAGTEATSRAAEAIGLEAGGGYRFRVVATNPLRGEAGPSSGAERAFSTLTPSAPLGCASEGAREGLAGAREGLAAFLPDCRAYEMVSPVEKNNADIVNNITGNERLAATLQKSSAGGSRMTYTALTPFAGAVGAPQVSQYIAARRAGVGWETDDVSPPRKRLLVKGVAQFDAEYEAFSEDLCEGWLRTVADPPLAAGAPAGTLNLYRRSDPECGGAGYAPLTTVAPPRLSPSFYGLELQGVSADGGRAVFRANDTLETAAGTPAAGVEPAGCEDEHTSNCKQRLYTESAGEGIRYACIMPNGTAADSCAAGTSVRGERAQRYRGSAVWGAISADGRRVFWSTPAPGEGEIFVRDSMGTEEASDDETKAVSAEGEALSGSSGSRFWCAAADGSAALFTTGGELYESHPQEEATDPVAGEVLGLAGCSRDASRVYFASEEALGGAGENGEGAEAVPGRPNLYLYQAPAEAGEEGSYAFVGTLAGADLGERFSPLAAEPPYHVARVTPSGGTLAFMSAAALTGQENIDAESGEADKQAFLYDAATGRLACASCNPTGARPVGVELDNSVEPVAPQHTAVRIPGWENPLYGARALSDDGGRLFFESVDRLVARDTNGRRDVYQWEAAGEGTCTVSSPSYSPRDSGCVDLISSGQGTRNVEFRDASPSGEDVFFATGASLLPQDPGLVDIYDARVGGGLPTPPEAGPPCEGDACQPAATAPPAKTPASSAFHGPGDIREGRASRCAHPAHRAQRLARAAKHLRRSARRATRHPAGRRRARRMNKKARRYAKSARRLSGSARRCRARVARRARR